jgi:hypothetical protein
MFLNSIRLQRRHLTTLRNFFLLLICYLLHASMFLSFHLVFLLYLQRFFLYLHLYSLWLFIFHVVLFLKNSAITTMLLVHPLHLFLLFVLTFLIFSILFNFALQINVWHLRFPAELTVCPPPLLHSFHVYTSFLLHLAPIRHLFALPHLHLFTIPVALILYLSLVVPDTFPPLKLRFYLFEIKYVCYFISICE